MARTFAFSEKLSQVQKSECAGEAQSPPDVSCEAFNYQRTIVGQAFQPDGRYAAVGRPSRGFLQTRKPDLLERGRSRGGFVTELPAGTVANAACIIPEEAGNSEEGVLATPLWRRVAQVLRI